MANHIYRRLSLLGGNGFVDMLHRRMLVTLIMLLLLFAGVLFRLWQVQVWNGEEYIRNAQRQSLRPIRLNPVRGRIYASDGTPLVENSAHYDLVFYISEMRSPGRLRKTIEHILESERKITAYLGRPSQITYDDVFRQLQKRPVLPMTVIRDLSVSERVRFAEYLPKIPGVEILARAVRDYPQGGVLSHILGTTGWRLPDGSDILEDLPRFYVTPDLVGLNGLEAVCNDTLGGTAGSRTLVVDSVGYARDYFEEELEPIAGNDLILTIDINAQKFAEELLADYSGALVAVDIKSGAVLTMASAPTFDLSRMSSADYRQLTLHDPLQRKLNRVLRGTYTPGSIMKPLLALAALEYIPDIVNETYLCTGIFRFGEKGGIRCAKRFGHGVLDLERAMAYSCNPFFIHLGVQLGIDRYSQFLRSAGIGERSGIELGESCGILPERAYAERHWKRKWLFADTAFVSIGQGAVTLTPMQAVMYTAAIANGGKLLRPYIVQRVQTQSGEVVRQASVEVRHRLPVSEANLARVQHAMEMVVTAHGGGAPIMREAGIPMAAKTGTAEVADPTAEGGKHKNTWVICYGPVDNPQIAVACVVEKGKSGGTTAVPIATEFVKYYFKRM